MIARVFSQNDMLTRARFFGCVGHCWSVIFAAWSVHGLAAHVRRIGKCIRASVPPFFAERSNLKPSGFFASDAPVSLGIDSDGASQQLSEWSSRSGSSAL